MEALLVVLASSCAAYMLGHSFRSMRYVREVAHWDAAWGLFESGELDRAKRAFAALAESRDVRTRFEGRRGLAFIPLVRGELGVARASLVELRDELPDGNMHRAYLGEAAALCAVLQGDCDTARRELADLEQQTWLRPTVDSVLACREERFDESLRTDSPAPRTHPGRMIRLMDAYAMARLGDDDVGAVLALTHPRYVGEFDYLATAWPELREFLDANPLPAPPIELPSARVVKH